MASTSDTGHAKNVAIFESLISSCTAFGVTYNPSKASIKLPALTALQTSAAAALQTVKTSKAAYDNATNAREVSFKPLKPFATKIVSALAATDASTQTVDDLKTINRKLQGSRAKAIEKPAPSATPPATPAKNVSASQQSFDNIIDHFTQMIALLAAEPKYLPNENELKLAALNTLLADLKAKNSAVINADTALKNARIARNKVLYAPATGMVDTALAVKAYVKSLFGATSSQYKQVAMIKFTKMSTGK
jgi:hypothetical protein